jgi:hypothetical protein
VSIFRKPESRNARITMILMATILGSLVLGVSVLASITHPVPYVSGTPTVISQVAKYVYGSQGLGGVLYAMLQIGTTLILILAANTSFGISFSQPAAEDPICLAVDEARPPSGSRPESSCSPLCPSSCSSSPGLEGQTDTSPPLACFTGWPAPDGEASPDAPGGPWTQLAINGTASVLPSTCC